ncbi:MAG: DUF2797 domain-containing protein [Bacteroidota bacterium]|nr:DUF2797 domain-containing protein [Bacteroidota bacterium]
MSSFLLQKMQTEIQSPIKYSLRDENSLIELNNYLGKILRIEFTGQINCMKCGKEIKKTFQGYCYSCFSTSPETDACIIHPEKCLAHKGISRDIEWAKEVCLRPHYVYLAKTNKIKVGVTRATQIPTRWIDQGADSAIKLAKTPYRQLAGEIEVEMKKYFSDKTAWRAMLKNETSEDDLLVAKKKAIEQMPESLKKFIIPDNIILNLKYPQISTPEKIQSLKLDKTPIIEGKLTGIKGQYLIFDNENVFNVRSHSGYNVNIFN